MHIFLSLIVTSAAKVAYLTTKTQRQWHWLACEINESISTKSESRVSLLTFC